MAKRKVKKTQTVRMSEEAWNEYIRRLRLLSDDTYNWVMKWLDGLDIAGLSDAEWNRFVNLLYINVVKNGEAAATLSAELFEYMTQNSLENLATVDMFVNDDIRELYRMVYGVKKYGNPKLIAEGASRYVKLSSVDTVLGNALKYGCEVAWIPHGDTCAFCIALASNGWQPASKKLIKNGHAEHVHANCDCTFAVRYSRDVEVEGYDDGKKYRKIYYDAKGSDSSERIKNLRRELDAENKEEIKKQQHEAYEERKKRKEQTEADAKASFKEASERFFDI